MPKFRALSGQPMFWRSSSSSLSGMDGLDVPAPMLIKQLLFPARNLPGPCCSCPLALSPVGVSDCRDGSRLTSLESGQQRMLVLNPAWHSRKRLGVFCQLCPPRPPCFPGSQKEIHTGLVAHTRHRRRRRSSSHPFGYTSPFPLIPFVHAPFPKPSTGSHLVLTLLPPPPLRPWMTAPALPVVDQQPGLAAYGMEVPISA